MKLNACRPASGIVVATVPGREATFFDTAAPYANGANEELVAGAARRPRCQARRSTPISLVGKIAGLAVAKGCTASQLALAWVLAQGDDVRPIPWTKKVHYLKENVANADLVLRPDDLAAIDAALPAAAALGERYTPEGMGTVNC